MPVPCTSAEFDRRGHWEKIINATFAPDACPLWTGLGKGAPGLAINERLCSPSPPRRRWSSSCDVPDSTTVLLGNGDRTIYLVGDSLVGDLRIPLICRLFRDAQRRQLNATVGTQFVTLLPRQWTAKKQYCGHCAHDLLCQRVAIHKNPVSGPAANFTTCFMKAGENRADRAVDAALALVQMQVARPGDAIVFNEGLWHNNRTYTHSVLRSLLAAVTGSGAADPIAGGAAGAAITVSNLSSAVLNREAAMVSHAHILQGMAGISLIWRESTPQHFPGSGDGRYDHGWYATGKVGCTPTDPDLGRRDPEEVSIWNACLCLLGAPMLCMQLP